VAVTGGPGDARLEWEEPLSVAPAASLASRIRNLGRARGMARIRLIHVGARDRILGMRLETNRAMDPTLLEALADVRFTTV
jgi:hypothetical protein